MKKVKTVITDADKFFANLHNDSSIAGTFLEGYSTAEYAKYLLRLSQDLESMNPQLYKKLLPLHSSFQMLSQNNVMAAEAINSQSEVVFESGWRGADDYSGHAIIGEMRQEEDGSLLVIVYNTGSGLEYHARKFSSKGTLYSSAKIYRVPKEKNNEAIRKIIIQTLTKPNSEPIVEPNSGLIPSKTFYLNLAEAMFRAEATELNPDDFNISFATAQRAGTCSWSVVMALLKTKLDRLSYLLCKFEVKLQSLKEYFHIIKASNRIEEELLQDQLLRACENFARLIEKLETTESSPILSQDKKEASLALISSIKEEIFKRKQEVKVTFTTMEFPTQELKLTTLGTPLSITFDFAKATTQTEEGSEVQITFPSFNHKNILKSFLNLKKLILNKDIDPLVRLVAFEDIINHIDFPLQESMFNSLDKTELARLNEFLSEISKAHFELCTKFTEIRYESKLTVATLNYIAIFSAAKFLNPDKYKTVIKSAHGLLIPLFEGVTHLLDNDILFLNPDLSNRMKEIVKHSLLVQKNITDLKEETSEIKSSESLSRQQKLEEILSVFSISDSEIDRALALGFYKLLAELDARTKQMFDNTKHDKAYMRSTHMDKGDILKSFKLEIPSSESSNTHYIFDSTIDRFSFRNLTNDRNILIKKNTEYTESTSANSLSISKEQATPEVAFIYDLAMLYLAKESIISFIYEFIARFPDKLSNLTVQDVIFTNLFKNNNLYIQINQYPDAINDLVELLESKLTIYYKPNSPSTNYLFILKITTYLALYLSGCDESIKKIPSISNAIIKLEKLNEQIKELTDKNPKNIEIRILQINWLKSTLSSKSELTRQDVIDLLSCFLILNSMNYLVEGKLLDPWLARTEILELIISKKSNIEEKLQNDEEKNHIVRTLIERIYGVIMNTENPITGEYPIFKCMLSKGEACSINLMTGDFKVASVKVRDTPPDIARNDLYKFHFKDQLFYGQIRDEKTFSFTDTANEIQYIFVKNADKSELLRCFDWPNKSTHYIYLPDSSKLDARIPATMLDSRYDIWASKDSLIITEHETKKIIYTISSHEITNVTTGQKLMSFDDLRDNQFIAKLLDFEAFRFIEIWRTPNEPYEYSIKLQRYGIEFISNDGGITFIWKTDSRYKISSVTRQGIISDFDNYLYLEPIDKLSDLRPIILIPQQEIMFAIDRKDNILDTNDELQIRKRIYDSTGKILLSNNTKIDSLIQADRAKTRAYLYNNTQNFSVITLNSSGKKLEPHTVEDLLHTAYIYLCQNQNKAAMKMLKSALIHYRGNEKEIIWLTRIISTQPAFIPLTLAEKNSYERAKKLSAENIAVKAYALYLLATHPESIGKMYKSERIHVNSDAIFCMDKYYDIINNIPKNMQLDRGSELVILQQFSDPVTTERLLDIEQHLSHDSRLKERLSIPKDELIPVTLSLNDIKDLPQKLSELLSKAEAPRTGRKNLDKLSYESDYTPFVQSILPIMELLLENKDSEQKNELVAHIQRMTMILFNPIGNTYEYANALSSQDADTIRKILILLNYLHKYSKQFTPDILFTLRSVPFVNIDKEGSTSNISSSKRSQSFLLDSVFTRAQEQSEILAGSNSIIINYYKPKLESVVKFSPVIEDQVKPMPIPTLENSIDQISVDMNELCALANIELNANSEFSYPQKISINTNYAEIIYQDFQYDCEIGEIQIAQNKQRQQNLTNQLRPDNLTAILHRTIEIIDELNISLEKEKEDIVNFANTVTKSKKEFAELKLASRRKHTLDFAEILQLYLLQDQSKYSEHTFLSVEEAIVLQQQIFEYLLKATRLEHLQRISKTIKAIQTSNNDVQIHFLKNDLANLLNSKRVYQATTNPEMLLFEYLEKILIRGEQAKYLYELIGKDSDKVKNILAHIIMGGGKSKVLLPLLAQLKANGTNLAILVVSRDMYQTNLSDLSETSKRLFNQNCYEFNFNRETDCSGNYFKNWYFSLLQIIEEGSYILTIPESLQSLDLKYIELLQNSTNIPEDSIYYLQKILSLIQLRGDVIIDEVDQNLQTKKLLNYAISGRNYVGAAYSNLPEDAMNFYKFLYANFNIQDIISGKKSLSEKSLQDSLINDIAQKLLNNPDSILIKILRSDRAFIDLDHNDKQKLIDFLCSFENSAPEFLARYSPQTLDRLAYIRANLCGLLINTLTLHKDEHYGLRESIGNSIKSNIAVPYVASKTPSLNSEFSSILKQINCTLQVHMGSEVRYDIFQILIQDFYTRYMQALDISITEAQQLNDEFAALTGLHDIKLQEISLDSKEILELYSLIRNSKSVQEYVLVRFILPGITFNTKQLHSDPQRFIRMFRTIQGITGTPYNYRTLNPHLEFNSQLSIGTDGKTVANIKRNTTDIHKLSNHETIEQIFSRLKARNKVHALIDQGAYFRDLPNEEVAQKLRKIFAGSDIEYILYFDSSNILSSISVNPNLPNIDLTTIQELLQKKPEIFFTYYDQKHATGVDIPQYFDAHALISISDTVTIRDLLQAAMRMRNLSQDHKLEFIIPLQIAERINTIEDIINYCLNRQIEQLADDHLQAAFQKIKSIIAAEIRHHLLNATNIASSIKILQACEHIFINEYGSSLFEQHGGQLILESTDKVLNNFADKQIKIWRDAANILNIYSHESEDKIKKEIKYVIDNTLPTCKPKTYNNQGGFFDDQQEQELELQSQQENESEMKTEKEDLSGKNYAIPARHMTLPIKKLLSNEYRSLGEASTLVGFIYLVSLNAAYDSAKIVRDDWSFADNLCMSINVASVIHNPESYLKYKNEIYEILVVFDAKENEAFYVAITPEDAKDIKKYCKDNPPKIHVSIRTIHGQRSFDFNPYSDDLALKQPNDIDIAMQQFAYYNGDIDVLARNPVWIKDKFDSKEPIIRTIVYNNHPTKIYMLKMLASLNPNIASNPSPFIFSGVKPKTTATNPSTRPPRLGI